MNFFVVTLFPEIYSCLDFGTLRIARNKGLLKIVTVNPRDFTPDKHRTVDDEPYGGGAGMVMKPEPLVSAIAWVREEAPGVKGYLLSPDGIIFTQRVAQQIAAERNTMLVCGRYEGIDERIKGFLDGAISLGDFVMSGGEFAAMVIMETVVRLIPGVLGSQESLCEESFSGGLLEYPQYTRPSIFEGVEVPPVLRSGDHQAIAKWRRYQRIKKTFKYRPDLLAKAILKEEDKILLEEIIKEEP